MTTFKIGDTVWVPLCGSRLVHLQCPVCFGKLRVTVILGNDERVTTPCGMCAPGYEQSSGTIGAYQWEATPKQTAIEGITQSITPAGVSSEYRVDSGRVFKEVFSTREEALVKCEEEVQAHIARQAEVNAHLKENALKSFSWHVGYHRREAKDARNRLAYHEARAVTCQAHVKEDKKGAQVTP